MAGCHARAAARVPVSPYPSPAHAPCPSSPAPAHRLPEQCPDCSEHVFLRAAPAGTATLAAPGPLSSPLCLLTVPLLPVPPHLQVSARRREGAALSPPRYLRLALLGS